MPARVHALLVVRPDARVPAAHRLERTLAALAVQTHPVSALTIVLCGEDPDAAAFAAASGAVEVITASRATSFAEALLRAGRSVQGDAVWLLAQDTLPEADALAHLADALEIAPSVGMAAPKLVRWDEQARIVSLGVTMTRLGRTIGLADDEFDQGQHDATEDVLGCDIRAALVRTEAWTRVQGVDPALAGADEGLDLGVRIRLAGGRVSVVPAARVAVYGDGVAGPTGLPPERSAHNTYAHRRAQLHRRLAYAQAWAVPLLWLALIPVALWRTIVQLVAKTPARIVPEWGATGVSIVRVGALARARSRIRRARSVHWSQLAPLRMTRDRLRHSLHPDQDAREALSQRGELRFFTGGGAWAVLGALAVSIAMFPSLLVWPALGGGALAPLRSTVARLWSDAGFGLRPTGLGEIGPADPFSAVVAVLGSLWPGDPSKALVLLWIFALPLAVLGGWFAATRVTDRSVLRITGAVAWALAPTFLAALTQGRPAAVLVHVLLPWLIYAGTAAHRSWGAAGAASLLLAAVIACAPSLAPALVLVWLVLLIVLSIVRRGHGAARVAWVVVPAAVLAAPVVFRQLAEANLWALLADPGVPWAGAQATADAAGRALLAGGSPTMDPGGWGALLRGGAFGPWAATIPAPWLLVLLAPLGIIAVLALFTRRWIAGLVLVLVALAGLASAFAAVGIAVSTAGADAVPIWPGNALSLVWACAVGAALITLDTGFAPDVSPDADRALAAGRIRALSATVVMLALAVFALPALSAQLRGTTTLTNGPESTLPAFVAASGRSDANTGTVVLQPLASGAVTAQVAWGESQTLGGQSTVLATRTAPTATDREIAELAADLVTPTSTDVVDRLRRDGIGFVLLRNADDGADDDSARELMLGAGTALDQREGLDAVGSTDKGTLWRVTGEVTPRASASAATGHLGRGIAAAQLIAVAAALLLAVPTASSRRRARQLPRVVGRRARRRVATPPPVKAAGATADPAVPASAPAEQGEQS
ncbi:glycosyl transferase [Microbacterium protaetiae]|uniref:Glycosyl transferase n=1 Tax=Microbacterium protaetiae TaxID=2509458 RepID=A0A4P6EKG3_9MICO|nr:glycosyltransferase [Microbacterium protaetiae]QAY60637.1 glycosyl transferase [Microbacterium protaetiae]